MDGYTRHVRTSTYTFFERHYIISTSGPQDKIIDKYEHSDSEKFINVKPVLETIELSYCTKLWSKKFRRMFYAHENLLHKDKR